jgi:hypothetical protein
MRGIISRGTNRDAIKRENQQFGYIILILTRHQQINVVVPDIKQNRVLIFSASDLLVVTSHV